MRILESTERRLVIERETLDNFNLLWLPVLVNIVVSVCFFQLSKRLNLYYSLILSCTIGWLFIHLLFPRNKGSSSYWWAVICGAVPFLGCGLLSLAAIDSLNRPEFALLTLDRDRDSLVIERPKILLWTFSTRYPLNQIDGASVVLESHYAGSAYGVVQLPALLLLVKQRNGRVRCKKILTGFSDDIAFEINRFLLQNPSSAITH